MLFPIRFADLEAEYWHLLRHVSLWDVAVERNLEISGPDALRFAQLMTPATCPRAPWGRPGTC
jgi:dimethylsulfoniopropionate demethylase